MALASLKEFADRMTREAMESMQQASTEAVPAAVPVCIEAVEDQRLRQSEIVPHFANKASGRKWLTRRD